VELRAKESKLHRFSRSSSTGCRLENIDYASKGPANREIRETPGGITGRIESPSVNRLRKRRQPAAREGSVAYARARRSSGPRRHPEAYRSSVANRKFAAGVDRRRSRIAAGLVGRSLTCAIRH